jgi:hypothetical protein
MQSVAIPIVAPCSNAPPIKHNPPSFSDKDEKVNNSLGLVNTNKRSVAPQNVAAFGCLFVSGRLSN